MLNPVLYNALRQRFTPVHIVREGAAAESYENFARPGVTRWRGGEMYRVNCPYCGDQRQRLYISYRFGVYDPETNTTCMSLARCFNEEDCFVADKSRWADLYRDVYLFAGSSVSASQLLPGVDVAPAVVELPGRMTPIEQLSADHVAIRYLRDTRHPPFDIDQLRPYGLAYCYAAAPEYPIMNNRLVIPVSMHGRCVGWQGRKLSDQTKKLKYYNWPHFHRSSVLYNYDTAKQYAIVVVVEGVFDVWRVGPCGMALFGTVCSDQVRLLNDLLCDGVVVAMGDSGEAGHKVLATLQAQLNSDRLVCVSSPDGLDPGSMRQDQIWNEYLLPAIDKAGFSSLVGKLRPPRQVEPTGRLVV